MQVCLISLDPMLRKSVELMLTGVGFRLSFTDFEKSRERSEMLRSSDLVVVDAKLPETKRTQLVSQLQRVQQDLPVLVLVGSEFGDKPLEGLEEAEYLTVPFHRKDIVMRIYALMRAHLGRAQQYVKVGPIEIDLGQKTVTAHGREIGLTAREYEVLELLALRKGSVLSKDMFLNQLYSGMEEPEIKIIDVFICKIRRKLKRVTGGQTCIHTVWGRGYVMRDPDSQDGASEETATAPSPIRRRAL